MTRHKVGRLTRRNRNQAKARQNLEANLPHSFVVFRGNVGKDLKTLTQDFRQVMEPNTASNLKHTKKNKIKDFVAIAGPLNVTHLVIFSQTDVGLYLKICRMPHGPSLTFRIENYAQTRDVLSTLKKQKTHKGQYLMGPCLMTNLQPQEGELHLQLSARMFLDMFPTITPNEAKTESIKRCCLIHYDFDVGLFAFRHYSIQVVPAGISKALKKLDKRRLPDLSNFADVSDFMTKSGILSESEGEEDPSAQVTVAAKVSRGKSRPQKSSVKLLELGPRLSLKLIKIEEGLLEGATLYNSNVIKTDEEKLQLEKKIRVKKQLKLERKKEQEQNVEAKKKKEEEHKKKCLEGMGIVKEKDTKEKDTKEKDTKEKDTKEKDAQEKDDDADWEDVEEDDDVQYYIDEVGEEPDADLFKKPNVAKKRKMKEAGPVRKKFKGDDQKKRDTVNKKRVDFKKSEGKQSLKKRDMRKSGTKGKIRKKVLKGKKKPLGKKTGRKSKKI